MAEIKFDRVGKKSYYRHCNSNKNKTSFIKTLIETV